VPSKRPQLAPFTTKFLNSADVLALPVVNGVVSFEGGAEIKEFLKSGKNSIALGGTNLSAKELVSISARFKLTGKAGELVEIPVTSPSISSIFLVGVGNNSRSDLIKAGSAIGRKLRGSSIKCISLCGGRGELTRAHAQALVLAAYQWKINGVSLAPTFAIARKYDHLASQEILAGVLLTRDLIHTPSNLKSPQWMARQARKALSKYPVAIKVHQGAQALSRFGGLRAVGNSSPKRPPAMIEISYSKKSRSKKIPHVVLVGKGIMFDTGGVSLKRPYENMVAMKSDMAGAAAILGTIRAAAALGVNCRITGLMMCAENLLSATSQRPSDVITHFDGQTVEVIDTDAEGRLVLADGLGYAREKLKPDYLVDLATLTGAATLGLSRHYAAMYTRDKTLAKKFFRAGESSGDRVWHMPLVDEYRESLHSEIADFKNIAEKPSVGGGSITAALFLEKFVGDARWVHFDIAGVGRSDSDAGEHPKGGTGFGVRLLMEWLMSL
jgi:leucyl aminopeptidase